MASAPVSNASTDAIWQLVRSHNSCMEKRKQGGIKTLSREIGNVKNIHSYKYSGFVHPKTVGIHAAASGKGVTLTTRRGKAGPNAVGKASNKRTLRADSGPRRTTKIVSESVASYRKGLTKPAAARASRILQSQRAPKPARERKPRSKQAKAAAAAKAEA